MMTSVTSLQNLDWNFVREDTGYLTHGLHKYPGRMPPQIPKKLLEAFPNASHVLDPFCGSGTTLVEAIAAGRDATGIDTNPLAVLISRVKTTPILPSMLELAEREVFTQIDKRFDEIENVRVEFLPCFEPKAVNLRYWFSQKAINGLSALSNYFLNDFPVDKYGESILRFFQLCLSKTVRIVSYQRPDEFKLYRMKNWKEHEIDVLSTFKRTAQEAKGKVRKLDEVGRRRGRARILKDDFTQLKASVELADVVITSPPYGDSKTTLAYGQFSRYPLLWLGYPKDEVYNIDNASMGGKSKQPVETLSSQTLNKVLAKIKKRNPKRADIVMSYFNDLFVAVRKIHGILDAPGYACFVVGDRTVQGVPIPNHSILIEFGDQIGFKHVTTFKRHIYFKVLPRRNNKVETICKEHIVILYKE